MPKKQPLKVQLYTPHSGQLLLHQCSARFRVMACGRRFGKTLAATNEISKKALENAYTLNWWIAPTYKQTEIAFNLLVDGLRPVCKKEPNRSKMRIELINGSIIECRSAERYENLRGDDPSFAVIDEAAKCPEKLWTEVVSPALADHSGGAIFISTPFGRDWFYDLFQLGQNPDYPDWWSHSFPTSANPFIPPEEIELQRLLLPEYSFAQEFLAIFLDDNGSAFSGVDNCIAGDFLDPEFGHFYVIGWDLAKYDDYSVCSVIDCNTGHLVRFERFNRMNYGDQLDNIVVPLCQEYNNAHLVMDITGVGDPIMEEAQKRDISVEGYYLTNASKRQLVDGTVVAIQQRNITYPNVPVLINELKQFTYQLTPSGNIVFGAPEGKHDDCVISLCLAVHGLKNAGVVASAVTTRTNPELKEIGSIVPIPEIQKIDDAFIMERQRLMARSLAMLRSGQFKRNTSGYPIDPSSPWGIS